MTTTRRDFLLVSARYGAIFGLYRCFQGDPGAKLQKAQTQPDILIQAIAWAKKEKKPCVVIRLPKDAKERETLGKALLNYIDGNGAALWKSATGTTYFFGLDVHEVLADAVFVCLSDADVRASIAEDKSKPWESLIWIGSDAKRIAGAEAKYSELSSSAGFVTAIRELLYGPKNETLRSRAEAAKAAAGKTAVAVFDDFINREKAAHTIADDNDNAAQIARDLRFRRFRTPVEFHAVPRPPLHNELIRYVDPHISPNIEKPLLAHAAELLPWLILERLESPRTEVKQSRLRALIETCFEASGISGMQPLLPFGMQLAEPGQISGADCPACGMAVAPTRSRKFIGFLSE